MYAPSAHRRSPQLAKNLVGQLIILIHPYFSLLFVELPLRFSHILMYAPSAHRRSPQLAKNLVGQLIKPIHPYFLLLR
jgi:uncharacterized membrane protein YGL010W